MSKAATTRLLTAFHVVVFCAVFLRIDTFPLTWVPMYSEFVGTEDLTLPIGDRGDLKRGFRVTTAEGETDYVGPEALNMPSTNFRRIYYLRSFGVGPPKHRRERAALNPLSNWIFDRFYPDPAVNVNWELRIMDTLNRTLDRDPADGDYIVRARAASDFATFTRQQRRLGELTPQVTHRVAELSAEIRP